MPKSEGSRGGVVIGHTKSGKAIYKDSSHEGHKTFKPDDHKSAANLHQDIYDRAQKKLHQKHQDDHEFKPNQKVFDFLQHHQRQAAVHTGAGQKPGVKPGDKKKKVDPEKEEKKKIEAKVDSKAQTTREMHVANINKLRSEGKTGEARRLYDKHVNPEGRGSYVKKSLCDDLRKAKYIRRTGTSGNYKYYYDKPKQDQKQLLKEAFGKQITFSGPGGKEYSAHVYSEPDEEGKIILKFPSHGYRRIELASIKNPVITEPGPIVAPGSITKYGSLGWPPSGFKEPERKGNKTTEKLWHKLGVEGQEGRPDTTGKLSSPKNQYMSPIGSKCNLVGNVAFGKASDLAQRQLNQKLQMTEVLLTDMGIKLKTPIDFICQDMENGQRGVMAQFLPMNQHRNDKINLAKNLATVNKSLLHEIGHGIDYAMEQKGMAGSYFRGNPGEFKEELGELTEILRNSKFYEATGAKDAPGNINDDFLEPDDRFANYLKDESEVFARAFEVYTLNHAQEMVSEGKLPKEYVENFVPDYLKAGFTQRTVEPEAYDKTMDAVTRVMDKIFRNRAIQKAMKNIDLLETLRKNVVSTDDQGSATETGMYSNDLYSNASNPLMDLIRDSIQDNDFSGDPVRILIAPDTIFTCTKDTDGVYSGTVNKNNENVLKIEKQTLPTLLQMLKIKELIPVEVEEPEKEEPADDYKMKVLDLLGKLL